MSRLRHVPNSIADIPGTAFTTAEEAWFWFVRCHQVRREGAQLADGNAAFARPCDPDDVYRAVMGLARRGILVGTHLKALARYGLAGRPPDAAMRRMMRADGMRLSIGCRRSSASRELSLDAPKRGGGVVRRAE